MKLEIIKDHLDKEFESISAMCSFYNLPINIFACRIIRGWGLKSALVTPVREKTYVNKKDKYVEDYVGNLFYSVEEMCDYYGVDIDTYYERINNGYSKCQALMPSIECVDHLDQTYSSISEMCKFWGINRSTFQTRINLGWSLERALTTPVSERVKHSQNEVSDHLGNRYHGVSEMCKFWGINRSTFQARINLGWSLERALTIQPR